jgi:polyhydroxybutyrate depolymerase
MLDDNVSYNGNGGTIGRMGAPGSVRAWAQRNGCTPVPVNDTLLDREVIRTTYSDCRAGATAVLYSAVHGGHGWPNPGTREAPLRTSDILWRFFSEHRANDSLEVRDGRP